MNRFLKNYSIGTRISLALVLPVLGLIIFSAVVVFDKQRLSSEMDNVSNLAGLAPTISSVVHELQKERGTSAVFIGSKGKTFAKQLPLQHTDTDKKHVLLTEALAAFEPGIYGPLMVSAVDRAVASLGKLEGERANVRSLKSSVGNMASYYTGTISDLLVIVEQMGTLSTEARITSQIAAYVSFLQGKERAGVERAMGGAGFGAGQFTPPVYRKFIDLIAQQKAFLDVFKVFGTSEQKAFHKNTVRGPDVDRVSDMRKVAIESIETKDTKGIKGSVWFATITKKIDLLKKVEDRVAADLQGLAVSIRNEASFTFYVSASVVVILLLLTAFLVTNIVKGITGPIGAMTRSMTALADGEKGVEIGGADRGDEIGSMAAAVVIFKENMERADQLAEEQLAMAREQQALVEQRLEEQKLKEQRAKEVDQYISEFELTVMSVLDGMKQADELLKRTSVEMDEGAKNTTEQAMSVSAASEESAISIQTVASSTEQLSSSIREIARQVNQSTDITRSAVASTDETMNKVRELEEEVAKIGEVIEMITDIAEQTNLLALNATIEAARAGDAGKGFAVVASEVKNLANQTASATEEISKKISDVQGSTKASVESIREIAGVINQVSDVSSSISAAVEAQDAATREIASSVEQVAAGATQISSTIVHVKGAAEHSLELAGDVMSSSGNLTEQTEMLGEKVSEFLAKVRSDEEDRDELIVWSDEVAVGNDLIDGEHQKLIGIVNDLYRAVRTGGDAAEVSAAFDAMRSYTSYHFEHEEELMQQTGYAEIEAHTNMHRGFDERLDQMYRKYQAGQDRDGEALLGLLGSWWTMHITTADKKLAGFAADLRTDQAA